MDVLILALLRDARSEGFFDLVEGYIICCLVEGREEGFFDLMEGNYVKGRGSYSCCSSAVVIVIWFCAVGRLF